MVFIYFNNSSLSKNSHSEDHKRKIAKVINLKEQEVTKCGWFDQIDLVLIRV